MARNRDIAVTSSLLLVVYLVCLTTGFASASSPPTPLEIANTVKKLWDEQSFASLKDYMADTQTNYPDYIPAILLGSFLDIVYPAGTHGGALQKLDRVSQWIGQNPSQANDEFKAQLASLSALIRLELSMIQDQGLSEAQFIGSPEALRELWDDSIPFYPVTILFSAPSATVSSSTSPNMNLRITEIMYNPEGSDTYEFVELQNIGVGPLSLKGLSFASPSSITFAFTASQVETLGPGEYVLVVADLAAFKSRYGEVMASRVAGQYSGSLSDSGGRIVLKDAQAQVVTDFSYDDAWYSSTDGQGYSLVLVDPLKTALALLWHRDTWRPSQEKNGSPGDFDLYWHPARLNLRVTEVMYNPAGGAQFAFIELQNIGTTTLSLADLSFTEGLAFQFPSGRSLGSGKYAVVVANDAAFKTRYPDVAVGDIAGQYSGTLASTGGRIAIKSAKGDVITDFTYDPTWYPSTNGGGDSLVLVNVLGTGLLALSEKDAWRASWQDNGSPAGAELIPPVQATLKEIVLQGNDLIASITFPAGTTPSQVDPFSKAMLQPGGIEARAQVAGPTLLSAFFDWDKTKPKILEKMGSAPEITLVISGKMLNGNSFSASKTVPRETFGDLDPPIPSPTEWIGHKKGDEWHGLAVEFFKLQTKGSPETYKGVTLQASRAADMGGSVTYEFAISPLACSWIAVSATDTKDAKAFTWRGPGTYIYSCIVSDNSIRAIFSPGSPMVDVAFWVRAIDSSGNKTEWSIIAAADIDKLNINIRPKIP